jgi:hypothetical protein
MDYSELEHAEPIDLLEQIMYRRKREQSMTIVVSVYLSEKQR